MSTDFSRTVISIAKEAYPHLASKFYVLGAFMKTKFPYNTVVALEFLEHIDRDVQFLTQLKDGTKVIFSVTINEKQKRGMPGYPIGYPSHRRIYTQETIITRYGPMIDFEAIRSVHRRPAHWAAVKGYRK
jgi:2-polyprenyl-3-methyl-5-hydroxy-6-metoxy-1,4-benzoquinol methylase